MEALRELSAKLRVLVALVEPRGFKELVEAAGLSESTVGKWLKILQLMGLVERRDAVYALTGQGREYVRSVFTGLTGLAFELGLVREARLYATVEGLVEADDGYDLVLYAYPHEEGEPARVVVNLDDLDELKKLVCRQS